MTEKNTNRNASSRVKKRILEWLGTFGTLLGIVTAFFSFFPHLTTSEFLPMDPKNAFSYKLNVTNDGFLPVFSVQSTLIPTEIKLKQGGGIEAPEGAQLKDPRNCCVPKLAPGDSYTFTTASLEFSANDLATGDFTLVISYIPILPPVRMNKCVHYKSYLDTSGSLHWFNSPANCRLFGSTPFIIK
jgi:hypothetical protein